MMAELRKTIECPVCLEVIEDTSNMKISRCGHKYCKTCFDTMKERDQKCGICRGEL
jgi:hypothetical protein